MLVIECDCGREVSFVAEEGTSSPMYEECECGEVWQLSLSKVSKASPLYNYE